jgi:secretion/DNA translocation related TadE-like protein
MIESHRSRARSQCDQKGSATIWSVSVLLLIAAAAGWSLLWVAAEGSRHAAERAADSAALAAATAALHRLAMRDDSNPCAAAKAAAGRSGAELTACDCAPLDCTVSVRRDLPLLGLLAARVPDLGPVSATSRAGPAAQAAAEPDAGAAEVPGPASQAADEPEPEPEPDAESESELGESDAGAQRCPIPPAKPQTSQSQSRTRSRSRESLMPEPQRCPISWAEPRRRLEQELKSDSESERSLVPEPEREEQP